RRSCGPASEPWRGAAGQQPDRRRVLRFSVAASSSLHPVASPRRFTPSLHPVTSPRRLTYRCTPVLHPSRERLLHTALRPFYNIPGLELPHASASHRTKSSTVIGQ